MSRGRRKKAPGDKTKETTDKKPVPGRPPAQRITPPGAISRSTQDVLWLNAPTTFRIGRPSNLESFSAGQILPSGSDHHRSPVIYDNTSPDEIRILEPALRVEAMLHLEKIKSNYEWVMPASLLIPLVALVFAVTSDMLRGICITAAVLAGLWTGIAGWKCSFQKRPTIDDFVNACKPNGKNR